MTEDVAPPQLDPTGGDPEWLEDLREDLLRASERQADPQLGPPRLLDRLLGRRQD